MAKTVLRQKVVGNPGRYAFGRPQKKRTAASGRPRPRKSNPGQIIGFTLGNPGRKKAGMAKTKKATASRGYGKKHNPAKKHHHKPAHHLARRSNPGGLSGIGPLVTNAVFVIVGALGSKLGAQAVLGTNNVGITGYAANVAAGGVLWFLAERVMKNKAAASGILAGTVVQIVLRLINDYTPFGQYVSQLGMGDYQMQSFVTPQVLVAPMNNADISIPAGWAPRMIAPPAAAAAGMGGLYGGWGGGLYGV